MANFPVATDYSKSIINTMSFEAIGASIIGFSWTSLAWPTTNTAIFIPFRIAYPITIVKMFWYNGATVSGNIDTGIYNSEGTRLVSIGSTAQATINVIQVVDITDTTLEPGLYYMALAADNTTSTFRMLNALAVQSRSFGVYSVATSFVLPSSVTYAGAITNPIPLIGLTTKTTV